MLTTYLGVLPSTKIQELYHINIPWKIISLCCLSTVVYTKVMNEDMKFGLIKCILWEKINNIWRG